MERLRSEILELAAGGSVGDLNPQETHEWLEALKQVLDENGSHRAAFLLDALEDYAVSRGAVLPPRVNTPYINTISDSEQVDYPGDRAIERRLASFVRWNATAMVVRANKNDPNIGGHIATFASLATLVDVGMNHFFRASYNDRPGDFVYFQGQAAPGIYAWAFLEGRLTERELENFRHELRAEPGLSAYPHPWLMPNFWQFPTVSLGLGPLCAIYQANFMRYLENRGIIPLTPRKIWCFIGDGETDEPETLGALTLAAREHLDNLIFVVNCNLQRQDGPVRGNGSIIQELEATFCGAGWNVIKCIWASGWDALLARDDSGLLLRRMQECVDGEYQAFRTMDGAFFRKEFFGKYPELLSLVEHMTDDELYALRRGGHDRVKVYNAYRRACEPRGKPNVILAKTVKGYGMGETFEGRNTAHQQKKLMSDDLIRLRARFQIPISEEVVDSVAFCKPADDSPEGIYLRDRRAALGGSLPCRAIRSFTLQAPSLETFADLLSGSRSRETSTTAAYVGALKMLMKHPELGQLIVPIVPDEARTFGMESLFREYGIYASGGQRYRPVDANTLLYYKEAQSGQILQEGVTEAGAMAMFTAAGTAYANYGAPMIPFLSSYSMFVFQRVGDLIWAFADSCGKGFLMGGTAGRTSLPGEGLQHQDGHSHILASTVPTCITYDPAYAYEMAVIIQDGIRRMYQAMEDTFYYITMYNETYVQPPIPDGVQSGILRGIYKYRSSPDSKPAVVQLFGSGPILNEVLRAQEILLDRYQIASNVWSVTSYSELRREALTTQRWNRLNPSQRKKPYIVEVLEGNSGPIVAATDFMKIVPDQIAPWLGGRLESLGTDGFGRSDNRRYLRDFFEVSAEAIAAAALSRLVHDGCFDESRFERVLSDLGINRSKENPATM